jgi:hypothetical protein
MTNGVESDVKDKNKFTFAVANMKKVRIDD